jgi:DNA-binding GntR family transcriptional regulator
LVACHKGAFLSMPAATVRGAERFAIGPHRPVLVAGGCAGRACAPELALIRHEIPASIVTFTEKDLEKRGLHEILRSHGAAPRIVSETIGARAATAAEARILKETRGAPLLTMERTAYDEHGKAVEHGLHLYRASLCTFEVTQTTS